jgi:hypothetical protein
MRRWLAYLLVAFFSLALVLSTGCPKNTLKVTPEEGEEDPGPEDPRPTDR